MAKSNPRPEELALIHRDNFRWLTGLGHDFATVAEAELYRLLMLMEHRPILQALANEEVKAPIAGHHALPAEIACSIIITFRTRAYAEGEVVSVGPRTAGDRKPVPLNIWLRVPDVQRGQFFTFVVNLGLIHVRSAPLPNGSHTVYTHRIKVPKTQGNLIYTGVTRQGWQKRWTQHLRDTRAGSMHLFHQALRAHPNAEYIHRAVAAGLSEAVAMQIEEMWADHTLRPKGLNMIPGGYAGIRYLHKIGALAPRQKIDVDQREEILAEFILRKTQEGRPNPLMASLWRDDSFAERVICGPEGRLKPGQISDARLLASFGKNASEIAERIGAKNYLQVERLLSGRT